jgi:hypothetical protein
MACDAKCQEEAAKRRKLSGQHLRSEAMPATLERSYMKLSERCQVFAMRNDRYGYPWYVYLADVLTGVFRRAGL